MKMGITAPWRVTCVATGLWLSSGLGACAHQHHQGQGHAHAHEARGTILVSGAGEARGAPDVARSSIGVEARAASVQDALRQANAQITQILGALKAQGVADADLQTQGFSVSFEREYVPPGPPVAPTGPAAEAPAARALVAHGKKPAAVAAEVAPVPVAPAPPAPAAQRGSYLVNNQLEVTLRDVSKLGDVLNAATTAGANNIWGISFDLSDKRPLLDKARAQAIENAKRDAARVAELSGVKLGKLLRVTDGAVSGGGPVPMMRMQAYGADNSVPVQRGELSVSHQVSLEYAIE
jgi:uncharacterized protein YggE